jgi:release factor glutamine methyltransferase
MQEIRELIDSMRVPESVYPPREDSILLAQAVRELAFGKFLEIGCGSGIVSISAAQNPGVESVIGIDLNPVAVNCSRENAEKLGVSEKCLFVKGNLFAPLKNSQGKFDSIAFNPPYLPTEKKEDVSWDGGRNGRKAIDRFLKEFPEFLSQKGVVFLLSSSLSGTGETIQVLRDSGFSAKILPGEQSFFFEKLSVITAKRARNANSRR